MAAHDINNGVPVRQLSFAEYHQGSLLGRRGDAFLPPAANHANGYPNTTSHAGNPAAMPTSAPAPAPPRYDPRSTAQNAHLPTHGCRPSAPHPHSRGSLHLPTSPAPRHPCSNSTFSTTTTTTSSLAYPSPPSSSPGLPSPSQQPPRCAGCAKPFANAQTLKRHHLEVASCPSHVPGGKERRLMCFWCTATFQRRDGLKQHLRERCGRTAPEAEADVAAWYGAGRRRAGKAD